jgi:hypothetical protein
MGESHFGSRHGDTGLVVSHKLGTATVAIVCRLMEAMELRGRLRGLVPSKKRLSGIKAVEILTQAVQGLLAS